MLWNLDGLKARKRENRAGCQDAGVLVPQDVAKTMRLDNAGSADGSTWVAPSL